MSILSILEYPDPRLTLVAKPVVTVDGRIRKLAQDMLETMYASEGIGLAATQVNVHERLLVVDVSDTRDQPTVIINPEVLWASETMSVGDEGCLSVPEVRDGVPRHTAIRVRALDAAGQEQIINAEGLLSVCLQHEMDHLIGKVFVEYLSPLKRNRIRSRLLKARREQQRDRHQA